MEAIYQPPEYEAEMAGHHVDKFWISAAKPVQDDHWIFISGPSMPTEAEAIEEWNAIFRGNV